MRASVSHTEFSSDGNKTREAILKAVSLFPGIHFRGLQKVLRIANGSLQYHLDVLTSRGLVKRYKGYGYVRFYPAEYDEKTLALLSVLSNRTTTKIANIILRHEKITLREISEKIKKSPSTVLWHLKRLEEAGAIEKEMTTTENGRKLHYIVKDRELVERILAMRSEGILNRLSDNWLDMWSIKIRR